MSASIASIRAWDERLERKREVVDGACTSSCHIAEAVRQAVLAERHACAAIARRYADGAQRRDDLWEGDDRRPGVIHAGECIADDIMRREKP